MAEPMHGGDPFAFPRSKPRTRPCPHCGHPGGLCDEWKARLAEIRADLEAEGKRRRKDSSYALRGTHASAAKRRKSWKTDWDTDLDDQEETAA